MNPTSVETAGLTATFVEQTRSYRWLYRLSETVTCREHTFDYLILSWGRDGDTCVFPADETGKIIDFAGFGWTWGPHRWLFPEEMQAYVDACIEKHLESDGEGIWVCPAGWGEGL